MEHQLVLRSRSLNNLAANFKDPELYLLTVAAASKSAYELAVPLYALTHIRGMAQPIPEARIWQDAYKLVSLIHERPMDQDLGVVHAQTPKGMTQDYQIDQPSDATRKQQKEYNEKLGKVFLGPRHIGLGKNCRVKPFDARWPEHW